MLNLHLRIRFSQGNFKCFSVGSFLNLTFPVKVLGSTTKVFKKISRGNHIVCQQFKKRKYTEHRRLLVIYNNELLTRSDAKSLLKMLDILNTYGNFQYFSYWTAIEKCSNSVQETGIQFLSKFDSLTVKDIINFNILYLLNTKINCIPMLSYVIELFFLQRLRSYKVLESLKYTSPELFQFQLIIDQAFLYDNIYKASCTTWSKIKLSNHKKLPTKQYISVFMNSSLEQEEMFLTTEGMIRRSTQCTFPQPKRMDTWQFIRKLTSYFQSPLVFFNKNKQVICFDGRSKHIFYSYSNLHYQANLSLVYLSCSLDTRSKNLFYFNSFNNNCCFKKKFKKGFYTKFNFWLNDFFLGGRDEYSSYSKYLSDRSALLKT